MNPGCEQRERPPEALAEGYFGVDESRLEERVAMAAALGRQLRFLDLRLQDSGDWGELFDSDEALVLARIAATDLRDRQAGFLRLADSASLPQLARRLFALAGLLDDWYKALQHNEQPGARQLCARIEQLVSRPLAADLQWVRERFGAPPRQLGPLWEQATAAAGAEPAPTPQRTARQLLRARFFSFLGALGRVQQLAGELLPVSLQSQQHAPAAGLLLAFMQLYGQVQQHINRFSQRHIDFYYEDCLQLRPRAAEPDQLHLVCQLDPRADGPLLIPAGTAFAAGLDEQGQPISFRTDAPLLVGDAQVAALFTLRLQRDALISPEQELGYVTRSDAAALPWPPAEAAARAWPLFGGTGAGEAALEAQIGLAIASPLLLLAEGHRRIELRLGLAHPAEQDPELQRIAARLHERLPQLADQPRAQRRLLAVLLRRYLLLDPDLLSPAEQLRPEPLARRLARRLICLRGLGRPAPLGPPEAAAPGYHALFLTELCLLAREPALFSRRLGKLFARWLLAEADWLHGQRLRDLRAAAARRLQLSALEPAGSPLSLLIEGEPPERAPISAQLFSGLFGFSVSSPGGWAELQDFFVTQGRSEGGGSGGSAVTGLSGLRVVLKLRPEDPPIVACPAEGPPDPQQVPGLPMLRLRLRSQGHIYPYSLLQDMVFTELSLKVGAQGVRDLQLHNQLGRLDAGKPFMPFGPLPNTASYLVLGAPELARKNISRLRLQMEWSELPTDPDGLGAYYAGYSAGYSAGPLANEDFRAQALILRDGQWQSACGRTGLALFAAQGRSQRLAARSRLDFDAAALRSHSQASAALGDYTVGARSGFYKLQLCGPAMGFGHQLYPGLLGETVAANTLHRRRRPRPMPRPPYTPTLASLSLDYEAQGHWLIGRESSAESGSDTPEERVLHLHPFGAETIFPARQDAAPGLWPRFEHEGNLYIGLSAGSIAGPLSLHFQLQDEDAAAPDPDAPPLRPRWAYLAGNRWHVLPPERVLSDSTGGFLTSGIVRLDLPDGLDLQNSLFSRPLYWLRVSADAGFARFASLVGLRTQALAASRVLREGAPPLRPIPEGTVSQPLQSLPGLLAVQQIGPSFGMRAAEDRSALRSRAGERLQHRQRACTFWDYERLVLERFPQVRKVRCLNAATAPGAGLRTGEVLVVLVPQPRLAGTTPAPTAAPRLNAIELQQIHAYLSALASPSVRLRVRNASYERIQVRCSAKLAPGAQVGQTLRAINSAIVEHLSPWRPGGLGLAFDWQLRCEDLQARLRALPDVEFVTRLSLLQVAQADDGLYSLHDTARARGEALTKACALTPWSIALPMREHLVAPVDRLGEPAPEPSGVGQLGLGQTFIIGKLAP